MAAKSVGDKFLDQGVEAIENLAPLQIENKKWSDELIQTLGVFHRSPFAVDCEQSLQIPLNLAKLNQKIAIEMNDQKIVPARS
jgi:hypothetical protein